MPNSLSSDEYLDDNNYRKNGPDRRLLFENLINSLDGESSIASENISSTNDNHCNQSRRSRQSRRNHRHRQRNSSKPCKGSITDHVYCDEKCHPMHRTVDWLALPFLAFVFFLILSSPELDRAWCKYIPQVGYRWLAKGLLFFIIIYLLDRAITQWRLDTFHE